MENIFLFISFAFLFTYFFGKLLEKIRVPWIFAALVLGAALSFHNPFSDITNSETFTFLAQLGMYFLLFIVGFEINLGKLREKGKFIFKATFFIIFLESFFGSLLIHFLFGYEWLISILVAMSFATVGEAILIPILDEFKLINTKLGQAIIGIGTMDDIIEIAILLFVVFFIGSSSGDNPIVILISLAFLFLLTYLFTKFKHQGERFGFKHIQTLFLFTLFIFFLFVGIGIYADAAPLAAILAGISLRTFMPKRRLRAIETEMKTMAYGFFAPLFFLWIGTSIDPSYLLSFPLLILAVVIVSNGTKLFGSYIVAKKELGKQQSLLLGVGLSVRFSTSIIIIKILFDNEIIGIDLYSIIIGSSILFTFIVPLLFSSLLVRWNFDNR